MVRYPHTGVISFPSGGGQNTTTGVFTPGTVTTISVICNAQPNRTKFVRTEQGDSIGYDLHVNTPLVSTTIPDGAIFTVFGKEYKILQVFNYQKHCEIIASLGNVRS